jgi:hypothetical protein
MELMSPRERKKPNRSTARKAIFNPFRMTKRNKDRRTATPKKPVSSAKTEKIKSVCFSGRKLSRLWVPARRPFPQNPPDPMAILD